MSESDKKPQQPNILMISAGSMFTSMVIAGFLVGYGLDLLFDTTPFLMLACGVLGFIGGGQKVYYVMMKMGQENVEKANEQAEESKREQS